jgi:hypothetical protein
MRRELSNLIRLKDVATKLGMALAFAEKIGQTNGRMRIIELGLDSAIVTKRIAEVYHQILECSDKPLTN